MTDTICAIATPHGRGSIGIVRVSGPNVPDVIRAITNQPVEHRRAVYCSILSADRHVIDSGIVLYFKGPNSYTGEDVLEIQAHGNPVVMTMLMERLLELDCRPANPGEFTERAFSNDRIDLTQAEAVASLIDSSSRQAVRAAQRSLQGEFSHSVLELDRNILALRVYVESAIDFADEDIDFLAENDQSAKVGALVNQLDEILKRTQNGVRLSEAFDFVIAGPPNVGKSSLFNALIGEERAIVTRIAGTTRDVLNAELNLNGMYVSLKDTAGLHQPQDLVEEIGIEKTESAITRSDAVLWVVEDCEDIDEIRSEPHGLVVRNKCDVSEGATGLRSDDSVGVSALTGEGIEALRVQMTRLAGLGTTEDSFSGRSRHLMLLQNVRNELESTQIHLRANSGELAAESLRQAHDELGAIVGYTTTDQLLGQIFSKFCIGK